MALQHLRSSTASKRPTPAAMSDGQLALNTNDGSPGLFFKDSNGGLVKVGPVHVGTTAPNASPASGGATGNTKGEQWLDTSGTNPVLKIWDGSAWQSEAGEFVNASGDVMTGALGIIAGSAGSPGLYFSGDTNTGIYSPGADQVAISTGGSGRLFVDSSGRVGVGTANPTSALHIDVASGEPFKLRSQTAGANYFTHVNHAGGDLAYVGAAGGGALTSGTTSDYAIRANQGALLFGTNGNNERLRITAAGLVGVGTSTPVSGAQLTVAGSALAVTGQNLDHSANSIRIGQEGSGAAQIRCYGPNTSTNGSLTFRMSRSDGTNSQDVVIDGSGRLGIGTSTPLRSLHVAGAGDTGLMLQTTAAVDDKEIWEIQAAGNASNHADLIFRTRTNAGTGGAEALRITNSGAVGIGVTAPEQSLHIGGNNGIRFGNAGATPKGDISYTSSGAEFLDIKIQGTTSGFGNIRFSTGGTPSEACRIDASGRLLVGTSTSRSFNTHAGALQIDGDTYSESTVAIVSNSNTSDGAYLFFVKQRSGSAGGSTVVQNNDIIGEIRFNSGDGTDCESLSGQIQCLVDGTPGSNDVPGRLVFSTTADGASSPTERVRIANNGKTYIGTSANSRGFTRESLEVKGNNGEAIVTNSDGLNFAGYVYRDTNGVAGTHFIGYWENSSGTNVGAITHNNSTTSYVTTSDYRLKENVVDLDGAIDRLKQLPVRRFNFVADPDLTVDGFIAHEAQSVVPECVTGTKDAVDGDGNPIYQGIDQSKLVPLLTAALQEAIGEIESLKARVAALESA